MIAVVVPTIREDRIKAFKEAWADLFKKHNVSLVVVHDGEKPWVEFDLNQIGILHTMRDFDKFGVKSIMGDYSDLIFNKTDVVRNLGFAFIAKFLPGVTTIISLDDDVLPLGDTIQAHLDALEHVTSINWVSTLSGIPVRGVPYGTRSEAKVMLSHGSWKGVPDLDAPSQLVNGIPKEFSAVKGPLPKGVNFPLCAMNFAFKREALPYVYQAPMNTHGLDRFGDIWCGVTLKREFDKLGWAIYTGHALVQHDRASNVFKNLQKEALGIELNETFWQGDETHPYFKLYEKCRKRWIKFINSTNSK